MLIKSLSRKSTLNGSLYQRKNLEIISNGEKYFFI